MNVVQINAEPRTEIGKKATKVIRKAGKIPAVLYSKNGVEHFSTTHKAVKNIVYTPDLKLAEIDLNGKTHKAIVKEIDFHPVTDAIQHIDFLELVEGEILKVDIPVKFRGVSPGVLGGGSLMRTLRTVAVKTTAADLVDELFVDISDLKLGFAVRVSDIEVPEGIEIKVDPHIPVANVEVPRVLIDEEEEEVEGEEETAEEGAEEAAAE